MYDGIIHGRHVHLLESNFRSSPAYPHSNARAYRTSTCYTRCLCMMYYNTGTGCPNLDGWKWSSRALLQQCYSIAYTFAVRYPQWSGEWRSPYEAESRRKKCPQKLKQTIFCIRITTLQAQPITLYGNLPNMAQNPVHHLTLYRTSC